MKQMNPTHVLIGAIIISGLIILAAWHFIYTPDSDEAERIANDNKALQTRVDELNKKLALRPMYQEGIEEADKIIDAILVKYGPGNTVEKSIMTIIDLCNKTGGRIQSVSFYENSPIYSSTEIDENGKPKITLYKTGMAFSVTTGYTSFKKVFDYVNSNIERMNIENFTSSYNPVDGKMNTSLVLNLYSVDDGKHEYVAPVIEHIPLGSTNIFKTFERIPDEPIEGMENINPAA